MIYTRFCNIMFYDNYDILTPIASPDGLTSVSESIKSLHSLSLLFIL